MEYNLFYLVGLVQLLFVLSVILFEPAVNMQIYVFYPTVVNGSLTHDPGDVKDAVVALGLPLALCSFLATLFVNSTFQLQDNDQLSERETYTEQALHETGAWDFLFWLFLACVHFISILTTNTPVDLFALCFSLVLQLYFLRRLCAPEASDEKTSTSSPLANNMSMIGVVLGYVIQMYHVPHHGFNRYIIFFFVFVFDYFLCIAHTWDRCVRMGTIANCRLCYVCAAPVLFAFLYGMWIDKIIFNSGI